MASWRHRRWDEGTWFFPTPPTNTSATNVEVTWHWLNTMRPAERPFHGIDRLLFAVDEWLHRRGLLVVNGKAYKRRWIPFAARYCNWWDRRLTKEAF